MFMSHTHECQQQGHTQHALSTSSVVRLKNDEMSENFSIMVKVKTGSQKQKSD